MFSLLFISCGIPVGGYFMRSNVRHNLNSILIVFVVVLIWHVGIVKHIQRQHSCSTCHTFLAAHKIRAKWCTQPRIKFMGCNLNLLIIFDAIQTGKAQNSINLNNKPYARCTHSHGSNGVLREISSCIMYSVTRYYGYVYMFIVYVAVFYAMHH